MDTAVLGIIAGAWFLAALVAFLLRNRVPDTS